MYSHDWVVSSHATLRGAVLGEGDPVVFLHPSICDSRVWRVQLDGVAATKKAIVYDRRGFGRTRAEKEDFSSVADLMAVLQATAPGEPAVLVGCSQGGRIAIDTALLHPEAVRALVLISPSVAGAPEVSHSADISSLLAQQETAEVSGDMDRLNAVKARLWLDGPLQPEGRVGEKQRDLFLDMNAIALRSPPVGVNVDAVSAFDRLGEIAVPVLVICGEFDFPHIQERCRQIASLLPNGTFLALNDAAHVPSLDRPEALAHLIIEFIESLP